MQTLILGGTRGLGSSLADQCEQSGDQVLIAGRSTVNFEAGPRIGLNVDLNDPTSVQTFLTQLDNYKPVDRFFWCAGRILKGDFSQEDVVEALSTFDINVRNVLPIAQRLWSEMQKADSQREWVTISSSSGVTPRSDEAVYVASKFAQVGMTRSLALENKNPKMKLMLVTPGGMDTDFWKDHSEIDRAHYLDPDRVAGKIMNELAKQKQAYSELVIPRGSI